MSAIAGIVSLEGAVIPAELTEKLAHELRVYSGDQFQTFLEGHVFLACQARWITPESVNEANPAYDALCRLAIVSDACIDNRDELCEELGIDAGLRQNIGDNELLLLAYAKWRSDVVHHLIGDYAFVIWDAVNRELFGARDPLGRRTLYYTLADGRFAFCTTMRPLLALPGVSRAFNEEWLAEYLAITSMFDTVQPDITPYRQIRILPASHTFRLKQGRLTTTAYHVLENVTELHLGNNEQYEEALVDVVRQAVRSRLHTHRNVSSMLSGGLDSGTVVSFAAPELAYRGKKLYTFSYVPVEDFEDWTPVRYIPDERRFIQATAEHVGNVEARLESFPGRNPFLEIDHYLDILETPYKYFENSYWLRGIYELASEIDTGILLTGSYGNFTISWGPALDYYARLVRQMQWLKLYREATRFKRRMGYGRGLIWKMIGQKAFPRMTELLIANKATEAVPALIHPDFARSVDVYSRIEPMDRGGFRESTVDLISTRFQALFSLPNANKKGSMITKFSLRYGVWERDPTADLRVIRFCMAVPIDQYVQNGMDRSLLRRSMKGYLPDEVRLNQGKRGVQSADWLHRTLPDWPLVMGQLQRLVRDSAVSGIMNVEAIRQAMNEVGHEPKASMAFHPQMKLLMRSLIFYRFLTR
jgi:asparagine synthase (glutamine-hydrolysing)